MHCAVFDLGCHFFQEPKRDSVTLRHHVTPHAANVHRFLPDACLYDVQRLALSRCRLRSRNRILHLQIVVEEKDGG